MHNSGRVEARFAIQRQERHYRACMEHIPNVRLTDGSELACKLFIAVTHTTETLIHLSCVQMIRVFGHFQMRLNWPLQMLSLLIFGHGYPIFHSRLIMHGRLHLRTLVNIRLPFVILPTTRQWILSAPTCPWTRRRWTFSRSFFF